MSSPALSKSLFKLGLTCTIKLKHALARPALPRQADGNEYMQQLARGGYMFEKLVKVYYPGEDMFVPKESHADASARTLAKIKAGDCTLHEATFAAGSLMARSDIVRVTGDEAAIACANDNEYGLSSAVFGGDIARAFNVARKIDSGICHVNGPTVHDEAQMPFGGVKGSGFGRFGGKAGVAEFTELRWITIQTTPRHYPF